MAKIRKTHVHKDQMLTGGLQFYQILTDVSIVPTAEHKSNDVSEQNDYFTQARIWEKVIETIRTRANVVIIGSLDDSGFSFAVEHSSAIDVDEMRTRLQELGEQAFSYDGSTTIDLSATDIEEVEDFRLVNSGTEYTEEEVGDTEYTFAEAETAEGNSNLATDYTISNLSTVFTDVAVADVPTVTQQSIIDGAKNVSEYEYTLKDTFANLDGAGSGIVSGAKEYTLTDDVSGFDYAGLDGGQQTLVDDATNGVDYAE